MGIDSKAGLSRRDFLKMAGAGAASAVIPDLGIPDPPEPRLKSREELTEGDKIKLALPVYDRLQFVARRSNTELGTKANVPNWPEIVDGEPIENQKWKRKFPDFPLGSIRESLRGLDMRTWILPNQLSVFAYPQLNFSYRVPFDSYPLRPDDNGNLVVDGQIGEAYRRNQKTLPEDAVELFGGRGFIGELWKFKTTEYLRSGSLEIEWLAKRGVPYIDKGYQSDSAVDRMANVFSGSPELCYKDVAGRLFGITSFENVLFVPIGLKVTPNTVPNERAEFNA